MGRGRRHRSFPFTMVMEMFGVLAVAATASFNNSSGMWVITPTCYLLDQCLFGVIQHPLYKFHMDLEPRWTSQESFESLDLAIVNNDSILNSDILESLCILCRKLFSSDNEENESMEAISICGDCKAMFLEDLTIPTSQDSHQIRPHLRGTRYSRSPDMAEDPFSQQFSRLINLVRQNQHSTQLDGNMSHIGFPRRYRRALSSDNESEGFDNLDSNFGESDLNVSFGGSMPSPGESDMISLSAYGSDVSVDRHDLLDQEMNIDSEDDIDIDNDTDIDPMHAGLGQWHLDDQDEDAEREEEEADVEEGDTGEIIRYSNSINEDGGYRQWQIRIHSPVNRGRNHWIIPNNFDDLYEPYIGNPHDYLDARGFEELLEHLIETDDSRQGAPPASVSSVCNLPRIIIHEEHDDLICAVCKDLLAIDTEANQLPCSHVYHISCIMPWLCFRNSCPVCRYELPTDDKDYEEGKRNRMGRTGIHEGGQGLINLEGDEDHGREMEQRDLVEMRHTTGSSNRVGLRSGRLLFTAAPMVSIAGIILVLWFRNGESEQLHLKLLQRSPASSSGLEPREERSRRWWSLF